MAPDWSWLRPKLPSREEGSCSTAYK